MRSERSESVNEHKKRLETGLLGVRHSDSEVPTFSCTLFGKCKISAQRWVYFACSKTALFTELFFSFHFCKITNTFRKMRCMYSVSDLSDSHSREPTLPILQHTVTLTRANRRGAQELGRHSEVRLHIIVDQVPRGSHLQSYTTCQRSTEEV